MSKPKKSKVLRARCDESLFDMVKRAAMVVSLDESDVIRIAVQKQVNAILTPQNILNV